MVDAQLYYTHYKVAYDKITNEHVNGVVDFCNKQIVLIQNPHHKRFANKLMNYIQQRRHQITFFCDDNSEITFRSTFIQKVIQALANQEYEKIRGLLLEENIRGFKGIWSKNLYSLLTSFRDGKEIEMVSKPGLARNVI